jgi:hypothetical protein
MAICSVLSVGWSGLQVEALTASETVTDYAELIDALNGTETDIILANGDYTIPSAEPAIDISRSVTVRAQNSRQARVIHQDQGESETAGFRITGLTSGNTYNITIKGLEITGVTVGIVAPNYAVWNAKWGSNDNAGDL